MNLSLILFLIGILGFGLNRKKFYHNSVLQPLNKSILTLIEDESKINNKFILPTIYETFPLLCSLFFLLIVPLFLFNYYVFQLATPIDISNSYIALLLIFISSCSTFFILFVSGWNIVHNNKGNIFNIMQNIIRVFRCLRAMDSRLILLSLITILGVLVLNILALKGIFILLGISNYNIFVYLYTRICLLPLIVYLNNILILNILTYFGLNTTKISYGIFSRSMCESLTLSRLIFTMVFISIFYLCPTLNLDTPIKDKAYILVETRPPMEIPSYSDAPKIYFNGPEHAKLSAYIRRLVEQYSNFPVDIPWETKATQWSLICPNNPALVTGQIPVIGVNVPNVRGPLMLTYGTGLSIDPSVFIQYEVSIQDTPVTKIVIGKNSIISAKCSIIAVGHPLDVETRSNPASMSKSYGRDIIIGQGVMVGANSTILGGTVLGDFSTVKAGSVVNGKVIPPHYTTDGKNMWPSSKEFS